MTICSEVISIYHLFELAPPGDPEIRLAGSDSCANDLNIEVANLLPQRVAVDAEQVGSPDLIAPGCRQRSRQQRVFDLAQDPVVKAGGRKAIIKRPEVARQMPLDRG